MATGGDFYGFNASAIQAEVTKFQMGAQGILNDMSTGYKNFMTDINAYWASDNAVDFQTFADGEEESVEQLFATEFNLVLDDVVRGIHTFTAAHGATVSCQYDRLNTSSDFGERFKNCLADGFAGMNVDRVLDTALVNYEANLQKIIEAIQGLPKSISVIDPQGQASASFSFAIERTATKINEFSDTLKDKIKSYINEEVYSVEIGADHASAQIAGES